MKLSLKNIPLYKKLGYAGLIPFALFVLGLMIYGNDTPRTLYLCMLLMAYSSMILSFLSAVHWPLALKNNDAIRLSLSMAPTIICLVLLYVGLTYTPLWPLLVIFILFWHQYLIDRKYFTLLEFPDGYLKFRLRITAITSGLVLFGFLVAL